VRRSTSRTTGKKLVVIGIDGMDPNLLRQFMDEGALPNFKALADAGTFVPLGTSNPPQSPVAWSCFITGMDPGGHGVYDFLHPRPEDLRADQLDDQHHGEAWHFPLPGDARSRSRDQRAVRKGEPFWDVLADQGVRRRSTDPAAYPIQESSSSRSPTWDARPAGRHRRRLRLLHDRRPRQLAEIKGGIWGRRHRRQGVTLRDGKTIDTKLYAAPSP
jgi:predicted AlkP superfamily pyrophosphatase or phosphodiesterase